MNELLSPGANVIIDGLWGSTGKGKLGSYLADHSDVFLATCDFQPNAGHTTVYRGKEYVLHCIPSAFVNLDAILYIAPAASIKIEQFLHEVEMLDAFGVRDRIYIHPHTGVVTEMDATEERVGMGGIASTMQGTGSALTRKVRRKAELAKDFPELEPFIADLSFLASDLARKGHIVQVETAQGFDLSLNHGYAYPYVTSRDVTPGGALGNVGIPPQLLSRTWASMRAHPIRVGHFKDDAGNVIGESGPFYPDQHELTWEEVSETSGMSVLERTTVTKRVRRIFTWSMMQYERFLRACQPTDVFLNFVNYIDSGIYAKTGRGNVVPPKVRAFVDDIDSAGANYLGDFAPVVRLLGTGPDHNHMVEINAVAAGAATR